MKERTTADMHEAWDREKAEKRIEQVAELYTLAERIALTLTPMCTDLKARAVLVVGIAEALDRRAYPRVS